MLTQMSFRETIFLSHELSLIKYVVGGADHEILIQDGERLDVLIFVSARVKKNYPNYYITQTKTLGNRKFRRLQMDYFEADVAIS